MNRSQLLDDPEQQIQKGVGGREDINSGNIKGKDGTSVTTYNPIHPPEDQQRIKGSTVLGGDNMERETRDRDPVPTTPIHAASSPTFPDQQQKPKGADLRQEEDDHKRKAHHDVVQSKVFAKDSGDLAPNQLGEKSTMYRTVNESPSMSKEQPKSTKPNQAQAVDGVLRTGYDLVPSSSKEIDGALSVGNINREGHVSSKEQPKSSDGLKEKPRIENIKTIKPHEPPKDEADHLSNSEIRPRKTIEHPVMHDKEDHSLKEQHRNNFLGRENSTEKNGNMYATSNSLNSSEGMNNIPVGVPIDKIGENKFQYAEVPQPVNLAVVIQPPMFDEKKNGKIEVDVKVSICCRCSIL
ncbi:uncharacterized protein LOC109005360 isoform X2 [Juglans regia]|uniref:Uncharacterized protein LOC109005360 isoform X2 n=1 Tax=Juglans regia TaxID=51240 RepID=A0A6P9EVG6_JUGRE|nr:uncharacterized protein LOC109005360 isoform X2 [Juglans regia]